MEIEEEKEIGTETLPDPHVTAFPPEKLNSHESFLLTDDTLFSNLNVIFKRIQNQLQRHEASIEDALKKPKWLDDVLLASSEGKVSSSGLPSGGNAVVLAKLSQLQMEMASVKRDLNSRVNFSDWNALRSLQDAEKAEFKSQFAASLAAMSRKLDTQMDGRLQDYIAQAEERTTQLVAQMAQVQTSVVEQQESVQSNMADLFERVDSESSALREESLALNELVEDSMKQMREWAEESIVSHGERMKERFSEFDHKLGGTAAELSDLVVSSQSSLRKEVQSVMKNFEIMNSVLEEQRSEMTSQGGELGAVKERLGACEQAAEGLARNTAELSNANDTLKTRLVKISQDSLATNTQLRDSMAHLDSSLNLRSDALSKEMMRLKEQMLDCQGMIKGLNGRVTASEQQTHEIQAAWSKLCDQLESDHKNLMNDVNQLTHHSSQRFSELSVKLSDLESARADHEMRMNSCEREIEATLNDVDLLKKASRKLLSKITKVGESVAGQIADSSNFLHYALQKVGDLVSIEPADFNLSVVPRPPVKRKRRRSSAIKQSRRRDSIADEDESSTDEEDGKPTAPVSRQLHFALRQVLHWLGKVACQGKGSDHRVVELEQTVQEIKSLVSKDSMTKEEVQEQLNQHAEELSMLYESYSNVMSNFGRVPEELQAQLNEQAAKIGQLVAQQVGNEQREETMQSMMQRQQEEFLEQQREELRQQQQDLFLEQQEREQEQYEMMMRQQEEQQKFLRESIRHPPGMSASDMQETEEIKADLLDLKRQQQAQLQHLMDRQAEQERRLLEESEKMGSNVVQGDAILEAQLRDHSEQLKRLREEHANAVNVLQSQLQVATSGGDPKEMQEMMKKMQEEQQAQLEAAKSSQMEEMMMQMKAEHAKAMELQMQALEAAKSATDSQQSAQLQQQQEMMKRLQEEHQAQLEAAKSENSAQQMGEMMEKIKEEQQKAMALQQQALEAAKFEHAQQMELQQSAQLQQQQEMMKRLEEEHAKKMELQLQALEAAKSATDSQQSAQLQQQQEMMKRMEEEHAKKMELQLQALEAAKSATDSQQSAQLQQQQEMMKRMEEEHAKKMEQALEAAKSSTDSQQSAQLQKQQEMVKRLQEEQQRALEAAQSAIALKTKELKAGKRKQDKIMKLVVSSPLTSKTSPASPWTVDEPVSGTLPHPVSRPLTAPKALPTRHPAEPVRPLTPPKALPARQLPPRRSLVKSGSLRSLTAISETETATTASPLFPSRAGNPQMLLGEGKPQQPNSRLRFNVPDARAASRLPPSSKNSLIGGGDVVQKQIEQFFDGLFHTMKKRGGTRRGGGGGAAEPPALKRIRNTFESQLKSEIDKRVKRIIAGNDEPAPKKSVSGALVRRPLRCMSCDRPLPNTSSLALGATSGHWRDADLVAGKHSLAPPVSPFKNQKFVLRGGFKMPKAEPIQRQPSPTAGFETAAPPKRRGQKRAQRRPMSASPSTRDGSLHLRFPLV